MYRPVLKTLVCTVALLAVSTAQAMDQHISAQSSAAPASALDGLWSGSLLSTPEQVHAPFTENPRVTQEVPLRQIQAPPSSTVLFLSALLSVGLWQAARSSRDIHLGAMPDWYHTGGPVQVGHSTPFDLNYDNLILCSFDEVDDGSYTPSVAFAQHTAKLVERCLPLSVAGPRAPPIRPHHTICS